MLLKLKYILESVISVGENYISTLWKVYLLLLIDNTIVGWQYLEISSPLESNPYVIKLYAETNVFLFFYI